MRVASLAGPKSFGDNYESARNLLCYLSMRTFDLRDVQESLSELGVSSLGRAEGHVLYTLDAVLKLLYGTVDRSPPPRPFVGQSPDEAKSVLDTRAASTLGPRPLNRATRIMVTMPSEAALDGALVRRLLASGMDCARINCAHDSRPEWSGMLGNIRAAEKDVGRRCTVLMDIAGPKIRTGPINPGPQLLKVRPEKDVRGKVVRAAHISLVSHGSSEQSSTPAIPVPEKWLDGLAPGDKVRLLDASGSPRRLKVISKGRHCAKAELSKTTYFETGLALWYKRDGRKKAARVGQLPYLRQTVHLQRGDTAILTGSGAGRDAVRDSNGDVLDPAVIVCTPPEVISDLKKGEKLWFDDGRIGAVVELVESSRATVRIVSAAPEGSKLLEDKGINFPESNLRLPPLTAKDERDLSFISRRADMVGYSFVRLPSDVVTIRARLRRLGRPRLPVVIKVETRSSFDNLPSILLAAMRGPPFAVMIARGDLAVECGYQRLAEVQEEILWLCEAAHAPVIWATQVLEDLTKGGMPSRAEVTDAAMGERAECVMLNKGPHVVEAVAALGDILERMQGHQAKKSAMMRSLHVADRFFKEGPSAAEAGTSRLA